MGVTLNPYLHFDGEAADAIAFYADVLGGTTNVMTFAQMGMEGPDADKVMHGQLETDRGITLMVSDMPPGESRLLTRELFYTAITRARSLVVLLTEPDALERAVRNTSDLHRTTLLRQRLTRRDESS